METKEKVKSEAAKEIREQKTLTKAERIAAVKMSNRFKRKPLL